MKWLLSILLLVFGTVFFSQTTFAQPSKKAVVVHKGKPHHHPHHHPHYKKHPHKPSIYRPAKVVVYSPAWAPHKKYNRRWVYFPNKKCYWDNWRKVYVVRVNNQWETTTQKPADLNPEEAVELTEVDDDDDELYNHEE